MSKDLNQTGILHPNILKLRPRPISTIYSRTISPNSSLSIYQQQNPNNNNTNNNNQNSLAGTVSTGISPSISISSVPSALISSSSLVGSNIINTGASSNNSISNNSSSTHTGSLSNQEVNFASFEFIFSEIIRYTQSRVNGISDFEKRLNIMGYQVGHKLLSLIIFRDSLNGSPNIINLSNLKLNNLMINHNNNLNSSLNSLPIRLTRLVPVLSWIHSTLWKSIVGKPADILEHSNENDDEYMISDNDLLLTRSITIPKEMNQLSCGAYMAGIVEGSLDGLGFPARVTSHSAPSTQYPKRTTLLIKFEKSSIERERSFSSSS